MSRGAPITLVAATPTLLATNNQHRSQMSVVVTNGSGAALGLGGPGVNLTTAMGLSVASAAVQTVTLAPRDTLYGYSTGGGTINVLTSP